MNDLSAAAVPLFARLAKSERILLAGAGGGFDVMSALPLYFALRATGKRVHLANLTFSYLGGTDAPMPMPGLYEIGARSTGDARYFPEAHLARWLEERGEPGRVHAFEKTGVGPLARAYQHLTKTLELDAVVLIDGGTDILMHGDEAGLGTPAEDMTSLLAADTLDVPTKLVACVGFGIDAFHGVCHAHFLENVAALAKSGAFLGAFSLLREMPEVAAWLEALDFVHARTPCRESIVSSSIADAVRGEFGNHHSLERTKASGTELFINPLMGLVWTFDLAALAARCLYRRGLEQTSTIWEVQAVIEAFRKETHTRTAMALPG